MLGVRVRVPPEFGPVHVLEVAAPQPLPLDLPPPPLGQRRVDLHQVRVLPSSLLVPTVVGLPNIIC